MKLIQAKADNYKANRTQPIKYIVVHYTSNDGDTAIGNCEYFKTNITKSSAHYFVDETSVYQSVKDTDTAYHCGATSYKHNECRNSNSIGVELCSRYNGDLIKDKANNTIDFSKYYFKEETIENATNLIRDLMSKHNIDIKNVIRHYDVTGKICPAPFVKNQKQWESFVEKIQPEITLDMAKEIFSQKIGLSHPEKAIDHILKYEYGNDLLIKIARAVK